MYITESWVCVSFNCQNACQISSTLLSSSKEMPVQYAIFIFTKIHTPKKFVPLR